MSAGPMVNGKGHWRSTFARTGYASRVTRFTPTVAARAATCTDSGSALRYLPTINEMQSTCRVGGGLRTRQFRANVIDRDSEARGHDHATC
jgi:hypothetical protein